MTFIILIFGEITPKAYCTYNAEKVALFISPFFKFLSKIFYPLIKIFYFITKGITKILGSTNVKNILTEDEVISILDLCEEDGSIKSSEKEMINNVFRFDDISVGSIMVPRPDIFALSDTKKINEVIDDIVKQGFSRIPVFHKELNNVKGLLFVKDILKADKNTMIKNLLRPVIFIPETKKINSLFKEMSQNRKHLAIVVDEYGTLVGLVTLEDLVEEILGEIYDETDEIKHQIISLKDGSFLVNGETQIKRINKKLGIRLHGKVHHTLSSFIIEYIGKIPSKKEQIDLPSCKAIFEEIKNNRIITVRLIPNNKNITKLQN
jgi:putative hemolysin